MRKWNVGLADPVTYSVRRRYLDRDLAVQAEVFRGVVLEIGCGRRGRRGRFRPPSSGVARWICLDRDVARLPNICADATKLPLRSGSVDTLVCLEVLEYVWDPPSALNEFRRVLKPGGTLVLSTPFLHRQDASDDYWRFTEAALRRLLNQARFETVGFFRQGGALAVAVNVLRYVIGSLHPRTKHALSVLLRPFFAALLWADRPMVRRHHELGTFSTGYLAVARCSLQKNRSPGP